MYLFCLNDAKSNLKKLYFFRNELVPEFDSPIPQITCFGPHCEEAQIDVIKCEGVFLNLDYSCYTADILPEDNLRATYNLTCKDNIYEKDHCFVDVTLERVFFVNPLPQPTTPAPTVSKGVKYSRLLIAYALSQLFFFIVGFPIVLFVTRRSRNTKC